MKNKGCLILLIAGMVGFAVLVLGWHELTTPRPFDLNDDWTFFRVIGIDKVGKPRLLLHDSRHTIREYRVNHSEAEARAYFSEVGPYRGELILWQSENRRGGPYTFYIPADKAGAISKQVTRDLDSSLMSVNVKIIRDDLETKTQVVRVHFWHDDVQGDSIYKVTPNGVTPVLYGDVRKSDAVGAFVFAFPAFLLTLIVLSIGFYVAGRIISHRARCRQTSGV